MMEERVIVLRMPEEAAAVYDKALTGNDDDIVLAVEKMVRDRVRDDFWTGAVGEIEASPVTEELVVYRDEREA